MNGNNTVFHHINKYGVIYYAVIEYASLTFYDIGISVCCCCSKSYLILCDPMKCNTPGFPVLHYFPDFAQTHPTESMMPSNHLILCRPLLLLPSVFPSIRIFSSESALLIKWPKYWSFNTSSSNEYSGLISFRIDRFDLLAVQRTLKSLLQHLNLKAAILWCSALFTVQLSHPYMTPGKTTALTRWTFVGKVKSLFLICCLG